MNTLEFIFQCILWQDIRKPRRVSYKINRMFYLLLEFFLIFVLVSFVTGSDINKFLAFIISVYLTFSVLTYGAIASFLMESHSWFWWIFSWPFSLVGMFILAFNKQKILELREKSEDDIK